MSALRTVVCAACFVIAMLSPPAAAGMPPVVGDGSVPTLAPLLEKVTPAVVNIAVLSRAPEEDNPLLQDPFFRRFFGLPERPRAQVSAGSGVIVDAVRGLVLTNHHVIRQAQQVVVTLKDGRELQAELLGSDAGTDIALLKIAPDNLTAIEWADSDALRVGDYVLAIGNPFGLGQTVTSGIVSALGRSGLNIEGYEDFIQTDASINPGNSGGALVDLHGRLVGINTAIIGPAGGNVGIGFAVPSNMARAVMAQLAQHGEVRRGVVGLSTQELTPALAQALGLEAAHGAVVVEVAPRSPAARAGVEVGDVVLSLNGRPVRGSADLRNQVGLLPIGETVELRLLRDGRPRTARMQVEAPPSAAARGEIQLRELAGATVGTLEDRRGRDAGVLVVKVEPGSSAWRHGLRPGDLIIALNRSKIANTRDLAAAMKASGRLVLRVVRGEYIFSIVLRRE